MTILYVTNSLLDTSLKMANQQGQEDKSQQDSNGKETDATLPPVEDPLTSRD